MVWYPWGKTKEKESDTAPSRENRQQCWETRDAYFACLDRVFVVKPGVEGNTNCVKEKVAYEGSCAKSWVCRVTLSRGVL
jgi:cytochrome c oxidase assembly factor 6